MPSQRQAATTSLRSDDCVNNHCDTYDMMSLVPFVKRAGKNTARNQLVVDFVPSACPSSSASDRYRGVQQAPSKSTISRNANTEMAAAAGAHQLHLVHESRACSSSASPENQMNN